MLNCHNDSGSGRVSLRAMTSYSSWDFSGAASTVRAKKSLSMLSLRRPRTAPSRAKALFALLSELKEAVATKVVAAVEMTVVGHSDRPEDKLSPWPSKKATISASVVLQSMLAIRTVLKGLENIVKVADEGQSLSYSSPVNYHPAVTASKLLLAIDQGRVVSQSDLVPDQRSKARLLKIDMLRRRGYPRLLYVERHEAVMPSAPPKPCSIGQPSAW